MTIHRSIRAVGHETFDTNTDVDFQKNGALLAGYYVLEQDTYQVEVLTNLDKVPAKEAYQLTNMLAWSGKQQT